MSITCISFVQGGPKSCTFFNIFGTVQDKMKRISSKRRKGKRKKKTGRRKERLRWEGFAEK